MTDADADAYAQNRSWFGPLVLPPQSPQISACPFCRAPAQQPAQWRISGGVDMDMVRWHSTCQVCGARGPQGLLFARCPFCAHQLMDISEMPYTLGKGFVGRHGVDKIIWRLHCDRCGAHGPHGNSNASAIVAWKQRAGRD